MGVEADDILDKHHLTDCALQEGILINFEKKNARPATSQSDDKCWALKCNFI